MGGDGKGVDISSAERFCACEPPRGVNERRIISCVSQAGVRGEGVTDRTRIPSCEPQVGTAGIYFCSVSPNLQGSPTLKHPTPGTAALSYGGNLHSARRTCQCSDSVQFSWLSARPRSFDLNLV